MKISQKGLYALQALMMLARHYNQGAIRIRDVAYEEDLPPQAQEKIRRSHCFANGGPRKSTGQRCVVDGFAGSEESGFALSGSLQSFVFLAHFAPKPPFVWVRSPISLMRSR